MELIIGFYVPEAADKFLFHAIQCYVIISNKGGETMLCHRIIDLSNLLCTRSDEGTMPVQR